VETPAINQAGSEADLVGRIMAGDRQAEAELVERYNRGVRVIIRREVGDTAIADDLYQETFCLILQKIRRGDIREPEKLSGFVCGVARNLVIEHFRRAARLEILTEETTSLPHPAPNQLEGLLHKEKVELIHQVLKEMPNQRDVQVLFRFYIAEEEKEKICADHGLTGPQFNLVLHRARERYRELYLRAIGIKKGKKEQNETTGKKPGIFSLFAFFVSFFAGQ
jgi:RNA polymerase sigma-70 factor, ECF subfamily